MNNSYLQKKKLGGGHYFIEKEKSNSALSNLNKIDVDFIPFS
jgi:hypothetical protein